MAGFREFVTGEVLTAANVDDFLMKQSVQKYADAAARDAALGTAVAGGNALREGMVSYLDDENEVQYFDGTAWDAISQPIAGIGSNVVQTVKTDTFSTASTSYVDVTGLTVNITPTSATSKVLVVANVLVGTDSSNTPMLMLSDGSNNNLVVPASPGSRTPSFTTFYSNSSFWMLAQPFVLLHSPATTSAFTYKIRMRVSGNTHFINRTGNDADNASIGRGVSTITAIEVAP